MVIWMTRAYAQCMHRRQTPRVKNGQVQKKNNWSLTTHYSQTITPEDLVIDRKRPGKGYRHLLRQQDVVRFAKLLPDWEELSAGLSAVVLAEGDPNEQGSIYMDVITLNAWPVGYWTEHSERWYQEHRGIIEKLGVEVEKRGKWRLVKWDEDTARAFQLLHVFVHELGHLHDHTTKEAGGLFGSEKYAEDYATKWSELIWERYFDEFA